MIGVRIEGLVHVYPSGVRALDGVDLAIRPGEAVAIMGPNGCGKTTLVRHLVGLLRPTSGRVLIDGVDAAPSRVAHLAAHVGLSFQDPDDQLFTRSVRAEVEFGPRNLGRSAGDVERAATGALERTGLAAAAELNPGDLGASRRRLLAIASVLAMETPVVVLDEPTTGQDARGIERVAVIVERLRAEGRTVVAVSHDMRFVAESFERIVVMREGRVALEGPVTHVLAEERWEALAGASLEPTHAARVGARLGLGSTPTDASLVARLASGAMPERHPPAT